MNDLVVREVDFHGVGLLAIQEYSTGRIYAGINHILRGLGFDEKQIEYRRDKWTSDKVLKKGTLKFSGTLLGSKTGKDTWCIDIKKLPLALAKLEITPKMEKEMPELSSKLELYQDACADVLADAFMLDNSSVNKKSKPPKIASMSSATNAIKTLTPLMQQAGFSTEIQLLTAKALYKKADCELPFEIKTEQPYYDTVHIARELRMFTKAGKPASDAVGNIIKKLDISDSEYIETLESKGNWQGSVKKYTPSVIDKARGWIVENGYPEAIPYTERSGKEKFNHVVYRELYVNEIIK